MYTAELSIIGILTNVVYGKHTIKGAASAAEAYNAAVELSNNVEHMYSCYTEHLITVFKDGIIVNEDEYAECWKIDK